MVGLAVASAVGVLWELLGETVDLADVRLSFAGVGGDGEHGDVGCRRVHDEAYGSAPKVAVS